MQAFTTNRFDAQQAVVRLTSTEAKVTTATGAVEIRYIDEAAMLDAVCSYIEQRHWNGNGSQHHEKLLTAVAKLGETIRSKANN